MKTPGFGWWILWLRFPVWGRILGWKMPSLEVDFRMDFGVKMSSLKVDFGAEIPSLGVDLMVDFGVEMSDFGVML